MTTPAIAAAVEGVARALHDLALAIAAADPQPTAAPRATERTTPAAVARSNGRTCQCGGAVTYREWTSRSGKDCRAWKCEQSRAGEDHYIEWAS
jgi:hypothetical protein